VKLGALIALAFVALGLAAQPTVAAGITRKTATFKATVTGTQEGRVVSNEEGCDAPSGEVRESLQFKSAPFPVKMTYTPFASVLGIGPKSAGAPLTAAGSITRLNSGSIACLNDPNAPVDCGTKPISKWKLNLDNNGATNFVRGDHVKLGIGEQRGGHFFSNCAGLAPSGSLLTLVEDNTAPVSLGRLLNRRKKKIVVTGKGIDKGRVGTTNTLTYKLTLRRQK
jgi:hypothetical protein